MPRTDDSCRNVRPDRSAGADSPNSVPVPEPLSRWPLLAKAVGLVALVAVVVVV